MAQPGLGWQVILSHLYGQNGRFVLSKELTIWLYPHPHSFFFKKKGSFGKKSSDPDLAGLASVPPASSSSFFISPFSLYTHPATAKTIPNVLILCCQAHRVIVIPLRISVKRTPVLHIRWRRWWHESFQEKSCLKAGLEAAYTYSSYQSSQTCIVLCFFIFFYFDCPSFPTNMYFFLFVPPPFLPLVATYTQIPSTATWPTCFSGYWRMI